MRNLLFISFIFLLSCNRNFGKISECGALNNKAVKFTADTTVYKFRTRITYKTLDISGILIYKKMDNGTFAGTFINEFGIKGFDFTMKEKKAKMGYMIKNLDKWFIRKTIASDLHFVLSQPLLQKCCVVNDTTVFVQSLGYRKKYFFYTQNGFVTKANYIVGNKQKAVLEINGKDKPIRMNMRHTNGILKYEFLEIN
jgi:hypothetical protein